MGGACASAPSKSIEPPGVSTLSERLSKQLISVLGHGGAQSGGGFPHGAPAREVEGTPSRVVGVLRTAHWFYAIPLPN